ncbi:hypothetical protein VKT23_012187 [Stygiomarasmius scandens]|uniref:Uncharacterized protein n=1 Tax=Marasmiellus scandens TaxID=2682957 RepID=A0ABR1J7W7_9AGAR
MSIQPRSHSLLSRTVFSIINPTVGKKRKPSKSHVKRESSPLNPNHQRRRKTITFAPAVNAVSSSAAPFTSKISARERDREEDEGLALWLGIWLLHRVKGEDHLLAPEDDLLTQTRLMIFPVLRSLKPASETIFLALHLLDRAFPKHISQADVRNSAHVSIITTRLFVLFLRPSSAWLDEIGVLGDNIRTEHMVYWMHLDKVLVHRSLIQTLHILDHDLNISQAAWSLRLHQFRAHVERYMQAYDPDIFDDVLNLVTDTERRYLRTSTSTLDPENPEMRSALLQEKQRARVMDFLTVDLPKKPCDLNCDNWPTTYPLEPFDHLDTNPDYLLVIPSSLSTVAMISVYDIPDDESLRDLKRLEFTMSQLLASGSDSVSKNLELEPPPTRIEGLPRELDSLPRDHPRLPFRGNSQNADKTRRVPSSPPLALSENKLPLPQQRRACSQPWLSPTMVAQLGHRPLKLNVITGGDTPTTMSPAVEDSFEWNEGRLLNDN